MTIEWKIKARRLAKGLYALWYREYKVFIRETSRLVSAIFMPLFWYFIFGEGVGSIANVGGDYQHFIFPGFLAMTIIFSSLFNGAYLVWDKKVDFLKEVLVSPLTRTTIFFGKTLGGMSDSLLQAAILIVIGFFLGIPFTPVNVALTVIMLFALAVGLISLGLMIGSFMESPEGFGLVASFAVYPMFLLSGALYPLNNLPSWMQILTHINPATYAVDGLRNIILGVSSMSYAANLGILVGFDIALVMAGTWAFNRMKL
jgi:ABC-2 type transport system permease protein